MARLMPGKDVPLIRERGYLATSSKLIAWGYLPLLRLSRCDIHDHWLNPSSLASHGNSSDRGSQRLGDTQKMAEGHTKWKMLSRPCTSCYKVGGWVGKQFFFQAQFQAWWGRICSLFISIQIPSAICPSNINYQQKCDNAEIGLWWLEDQVT